MRLIFKAAMIIAVLALSGCGGEEGGTTIVSDVSQTAQITTTVQTSIQTAVSQADTTQPATKNQETATTPKGETYFDDKYKIPDGTYARKDFVGKFPDYEILDEGDGLILYRKDEKLIFRIYLDKNVTKNDYDYYTVKEITFTDLFEYNPYIFDENSTPAGFEEFELNNYYIDNEKTEGLILYSRFSETEQMNYISDFSRYGRGEGIFEPLFCWGLEKDENGTRRAYYRFMNGVKTPMTEAEFKTELMPDFEYNPPDFVKNITWHSESIIEPIIYDYYFYDENITDYVPQTVIDGILTGVSESYFSDSEIGWFGVMNYDLDDDGDLDILAVGLEKNDEFFDSAEFTFIPYGGHYSGIGINNNGSYKYIKRSTTKYNATDFDTDDGYILSTSTNGLHDIYLNAGDGLFTSFDGEGAYVPLDLYYDSNFIIQSGLINKSTARVVMMPLNPSVGHDKTYAVAMRCVDEDSIDTPVILYTNTASGEVAYYRNGQPVNSKNQTDYEIPYFEFYITAEMYEKWNGRSFPYISEVYYIVKDEIDEEKQPLSYSEIEEKISDYINHFMTVYTMQINEDYKDVRDETIVKEVSDVYDISTEGAEMIKYRTSDGKLIRVYFWIFGETYQAEVNFYFVDDFIYCTKLIKNYSCYMFGIDNSADFLYSTFDEYILSGEDYYQIDRIGERLIQTDTDPISDRMRGYLS
jgi:hypothetical protein